MQKLFKKSTLSALAAFGVMLAPAAEEAVVNEGKINVRGQPSLVGEVVTQLQRGDKVSILEQIKIENPKPGEPATWAKIKLPANTPVWVFSPFVKDGVVSASRLNLRAGPGDNYSVLGRVEKGANVKSIRTIEEWMEIEAPEDAYAFIDATLVKSTEPGAAAPVSTVAAVPAAAAEQTASPSERVASVTNTPPAEAQNSTPAALQPAIEEPKPAVTAAAPAAPVETQKPSQTPVQTAAPVAAAAVVQQPLPQVAQPAPQKSESVPGKRIVRREGFVRATKSIQAPTWYELVHPQTGAVINYLHEEKMGVKLKQFKGQKVIVSGEEALDPRWPNTPIMELESLDVAP